MNWCFDKEFTQSFSLKHIVTLTEDVENIYLTEKELVQIEELRLEDEFEIQVRDMFLIGCETALRFSDFLRLNDDCIVNDKIYIRPKKTEGKVANNKVVIPISKRVQRILTTHKGIFPNHLLDIIFEFNKTLKSICQKAQINKVIHISKNIAGTRSVKQYKKFELVSSHTARRTFCTNKYLAGMPSDGIMQFSGHKTERSFRKYLKMEAEENAMKYENFF